MSRRVTLGNWFSMLVVTLVTPVSYVPVLFQLSCVRIFVVTVVIDFRFCLGIPERNSTSVRPFDNFKSRFFQLSLSRINACLLVSPIVQKSKGKFECSLESLHPHLSRQI